jgi:hypothetical protein
MLAISRGLTMNDKTSNNYAVAWSEEICDWIMQEAEGEDIDPEVAVYAALAAAVVLARSVGMEDLAIRSRFTEILENEFPESMLTEAGH